MKAELRVSYRPDNDGTGELCATVSSGGFCGSGAAWFDETKLRDGFIKSLKQFPIVSENSPEIRGGFWTSGQPASLDQCLLAIGVRPHDARGNLLVQVELATEGWISPDKDRQQRVLARFLADYPALETFVAELEQVISGGRDFALLKGTSKT